MSTSATQGGHSNAPRFPFAPNRKLTAVLNFTRQATGQRQFFSNFWMFWALRFLITKFNYLYFPPIHLFSLLFPLSSPSFPPAFSFRPFSSLASPSFPSPLFSYSLLLVTSFFLALPLLPFSVPVSPTIPPVSFLKFKLGMWPSCRFCSDSTILTVSS